MIDFNTTSVLIKLMWINLFIGTPLFQYNFCSYLNEKMEYLEQQTEDFNTTSVLIKLISLYNQVIGVHFNTPSVLIKPLVFPPFLFFIISHFPL